MDNSLTYKTDYEKSMEAKLSELGAKIDQWMTSVDTAKSQAAQKLSDLNEKRKDAAQKFQEVKSSTGEAWTEFKDGAEKSFEELKKVWEELKAGSEKAVAKFDTDVKIGS